MKKSVLLVSLFTLAVVGVEAQVEGTGTPGSIPV